MNGTELRCFSHSQSLTKITYPDHSRNPEIDYIWRLSSFTIKLWKSPKTIKFNLLRWFTSVFLMNGKELRSFSDFQIFTKIVYPDLSRNLEIDEFWSLSSFTVKMWKALKMINLKGQDDLQVLSWWMEKN